MIFNNFDSIKIRLDGILKILLKILPQQTNIRLRIVKSHFNQRLVM